MTEERLIQYMASRKSWMSYEVLAKYFCVSRKTVQGVIKKLEKENRVHFKFGDNNKKLWQVKETSPDPVALPDSRPIVVHRIAQPGEEAPTPKRRTTTPAIKKQSWFSALDN